jgi:hypothetical protein
MLLQAMSDAGAWCMASMPGCSATVSAPTTLCAEALLPNSLTRCPVSAVVRAHTHTLRYLPACVHTYVRPYIHAPRARGCGWQLRDVLCGPPLRQPASQHAAAGSDGWVRGVCVIVAGWLAAGLGLQLHLQPRLPRGAHHPDGRWRRGANVRQRARRAPLLCLGVLLARGPHFLP